jgi:hypothetical protein
MEQILLTVLGVFIASFCFAAVMAHKKEIKAALPQSSSSTPKLNYGEKPYHNRATKRGMRLPYKKYFHG